MRIIRWKRLSEVTGLSRTTVWRYEKKGIFPQRRRLGPMAIGWVEEEVEKWIKTLPGQQIQGGKVDNSNKEEVEKWS